MFSSARLSATRILILLSTLCVTSLALADDATPAPAAATGPAATAPVPPPVWKANAEIGYINSALAGVTTETFNGKLHGEYQSGLWTNEANATALSAQNNTPGSTSTESYMIGTKSKRGFDDSLNYLFGQTEWDKNLQSDYNFQVFASGGYGRYLLKTDTQDLSMEIGVGFRHSEPVGMPPVNDGIGNFNAKYHWQITPAVSFGEKVDVQDGREDLVAHSLTELKQAVTQALAFSFSYDYRHDTGGSGQPGTTDRITSFNLIYQFH